MPWLPTHESIRPFIDESRAEIQRVGQLKWCIESICFLSGSRIYV